MKSKKIIEMDWLGAPTWHRVEIEVDNEMSLKDVEEWFEYRLAELDGMTYDFDEGEEIVMKDDDEEMAFTINYYEYENNYGEAELIESQTNFVEPEEEIDYLKAVNAEVE